MSGVEPSSVTLKPTLRWYHCRFRVFLVMGIIFILVVGFGLVRQCYEQGVISRLESHGAEVVTKSGDFWVWVDDDQDVSTFLMEARDDMRCLTRLGDVDLFLSGTNVSDADLQQLATIGGLCSIDLQGCPVTEKGVKMLRQALPSCTIDWEPPAKGEQQATVGLEVLSSLFYWDEDDFMPEPIIEIGVRNGTKHPISRAYFHGTLVTPGITDPWVDEDFSYTIDGGLEPGETAEWRLSVNQFRAWQKAPRDREDLILKVTPVRIDDAEGNPIRDSQSAP